jgi:hypothetical protein
MRCPGRRRCIDKKGYGYMNLEGVTKRSMKRSRCEVREKGRNEEYAAASSIQRANGLPIYKCRNGQFSHHPLRSSNNGSVSPAPASRWRKKDGRRGKKGKERAERGERGPDLGVGPA